MTASLQTHTEEFTANRLALSVQSAGAPLVVPPNPVFTNIKLSYLEALQALGYTESEARFLCRDCCMSAHGSILFSLWLKSAIFRSLYPEFSRANQAQPATLGAEPKRWRRSRDTPDARPSPQLR